MWKLIYKIVMTSNNRTQCVNNCVNISDQQNNKKTTNESNFWEVCN
jgi:hypothetical protein